MYRLGLLAKKSISVFDVRLRKEKLATSEICKAVKNCEQVKVRPTTPISW